MKKNKIEVSQRYLFSLPITKCLSAVYEVTTGSSISLIGMDLEHISFIGKKSFAVREINPSHVQDFNEILNQKNGTRLANLYGSTEATVDITYFDCPTNTDGDIEKIPIGKPIDNAGLYGAPSICFPGYLSVDSQWQGGSECLPGTGIWLLIVNFQLLIINF